MDKIPPEEPNESRKKSLSAFARYSGMAFQIAAAIILGVLAGQWLDKKFPMKFAVFTTILTILGVFVGVFFAIRDVLKQK